MLSAGSAMSDEVRIESDISHATSLRYATYTPQRAGGQKLDEFVNRHFSKVGEKNPKTPLTSGNEGGEEDDKMGGFSKPNSIGFRQERPTRMQPNNR